MKQIYLAGPFFNETEIQNVESAETVLAERGFSVFSPMRHTVEGEPGTTEWARKVFELDRTNLEQADAVVMLYYGNYSDTGTAWECGYACAIGKPVVLVHLEDEDTGSNLMMHCSCTANISLGELREYDFETLPGKDYAGKMF